MIDIKEYSGKEKCGFVAVVGSPNVGKSTLINNIIGSKITIVSPKVQTTRTRVRGIGIHEDSQVIFVDTPGIFTPKKRLDRAMVAMAWGETADADKIVFLIDAKRGVDKDSQGIIDRLQKSKQKAVLVLNKIDLIPRDKLLSLAEKLNKTEIFTDVFMISALKGDGVQKLFTFLANKMPNGQWMFPEDQISDMPMRLLSAEITREKIFHQLHEELPYAITVETESWEEKKNGSVHIKQTIYVQRESQKKIVIGKKGSRIKTIGSDSRVELEEMLETRVHLFLFVKVREHWGDDRARYTDWGLDFNA
ncbi:MAG: GTPase Era [Alphaproteobacteria bacterium]|nr:GTPase Era [Alphaproteobacteria bacterium]